MLTGRGVEHGDAAVHIARSLAWLEGSRSLQLDVSELWVPTRAVAGGLLYEDSGGLHAVAPPGMAALALAPVAAAQLTESRPFEEASRPLLVGSTRPVASALRDVRNDPRALAFALTGPLSAGLALAFLWLAVAALGFERRARWLTVAALGLGSPLLAFGGSAWTQLPACALVSFALWRCAERWVRPSAGLGGLGWALAMLVLLRLDHLPFAVAVVAISYASERGNRRAPTRAMARLLAPLALALGVIALLGWPARGEGFQLATLRFGGPGLLLSPQTGLLVFAPWVLLIGLGVRRLPRAVAALCLGSLLGAWVLYGGWFDWSGSLVYGPRFFVSLLPLAALLFGAGVQRAPRLGAALVGLGALVNLPGALVAHPRVPEPESALDLAPLEAWRALASGVDCASLDGPAPWVVALVLALAGAVVSRRDQRTMRSLPSRGAA